jgi:hypothetical protein
MRAAVAVGFGRLAVEHQPAGFQRLKSFVQLDAPGSHFSNLLLNVTNRAF